MDEVVQVWEPLETVLVTPSLLLVEHSVELRLSSLIEAEEAELLLPEDFVLRFKRRFEFVGPQPPAPDTLFVVLRVLTILSLFDVGWCTAFGVNFCLENYNYTLNATSLTDKMISFLYKTETLFFINSLEIFVYFYYSYLSGGVVTGQSCSRTNNSTYTAKQQQLHKMLLLKFFFTKTHNLDMSN